MIRGLILVLLLFLQPLYAQKLNFLGLNKYRISKLPHQLNENSGLTILNGKLYTLNDGGNSAELFALNSDSGAIEHRVLTTLKNTDWEAVAGDSMSFYIGDFGNNAGSREDLSIYNLPFDRTPPSDSVKTIHFFYPEQTDFRSRLHRHNYDAEAMIFHNSQLHIFTKEWTSRSTTHYTVDPAISGSQTAKKVARYDIGFLVTDAAYFDKKLYLVGYTKKGEVFMSTFTESGPGFFFAEEPQKYYLGTAFSLGQVEGIEVNESGVYFSAEAFRTPFGTVKPSLFFVPHEKIKAGK